MILTADQYDIDELEFVGIDPADPISPFFNDGDGMDLSFFYTEEELRETA